MQRREVSKDSGGADSHIEKEQNKIEISNGAYFKSV